MDNDIQFIDQRLAHHYTLIPQRTAQSAATEKRLADTIITLEIKRIEALYTIKMSLSELRALIPVYDARFPTSEHVLAKQIIYLHLKLIATNTTIFITSICSTLSSITSTCTSSTHCKSFRTAGFTI